VRTTPNPATMTVSEAGVLLGISRSSAYECVRLGSIPSLRLGRRIVVPRRAIDALLNSVSLEAQREANGER
jgi:excisionase family DNA binding protein